MEHQQFDMAGTRYFYNKHWNPTSKHYILFKEMENPGKQGVI